jgi:serine/threonine-protein phosphatase PP1 catalytic subunit
MNRQYGFYDETLKAFSVAIWRVFTEIFMCLPYAAVISNRFFAVHGGISPDLDSLDAIKEAERPLEIPERGMLCDLVWADPNPAPDSAPFAQSERGTSVLFSLDAAKSFLAQNNFQMLIRAHQPVQGGYEYAFEPDRSVITLFSAPNYAGVFGNKGAVMNIAEDLSLSFDVLEPIQRGIATMVARGKAIKLDPRVDGLYRS